MPVFRSTELSQRYREVMQTNEFKTACALCNRESLKTFVHWKIVSNLFPYDLIAAEHNMLLPLRHATESELTDEEREEFMQIKYSDELQGKYDNFIESTHRTRTIPPHFHLHLLVLKH